MSATGATRSGLGFDIHAFEVGRRLVLGGVEIPGATGLAGHSDADVLLHAIADAVLGACGLGDIGRHFPDTDPAWKDADSVDLLERVAGMARDAGWTVVHVDATVVAERPRLAPHADAMRARIADALSVGRGSINLKATTAERLGFVGRGEGIAALAVATVSGIEA